jgi:hypothetical protein
VIILGSDNAMSATGLCLVDWHPIFGGRALWWETVKPRMVPRRKTPDVLDFTIQLKAALHNMARVLGVNNLGLLCTEGAFAKGGRRSIAGIQVATAGGIVIGMTRYLWSCPVVTMQAAPIGKAKGWRELVLDSNPTDKDACVKECMWLAEMAGVDHELTEHVAEAFGIACGGGQNWANNGGKI